MLGTGRRTRRRALRLVHLAWLRARLDLVMAGGAADRIQTAVPICLPLPLLAYPQHLRLPVQPAPAKPDRLALACADRQSQDEAHAIPPL